MSIEDFQLIDDIEIDNSIIKRDSYKNISSTRCTIEKS